MKKISSFLVCVICSFAVYSANAHEEIEENRCGNPKKVVDYNFLKDARTKNKVTRDFEDCVAKVMDEEKAAINLHNKRMEQTIIEWNNYVTLYNEANQYIDEREADSLPSELEVGGE